MNNPSTISTLPIPKEPPDLDRFVAALLALALERVAAEQDVEAEAARTNIRNKGGTDG